MKKDHRLFGIVFMVIGLFVLNIPSIEGQEFDGPNLIWNTFFGSPDKSDDRANRVCLDNDGNIYVVGESPGTWGIPIRSFSGGLSDVFVVKLTPSGDFVWNTFLGGIGDDSGSGIAVDGSGNVIISGKSGTTWGTPIRLFSGGEDGFVAKLNSLGELQWNTFLGGSVVDNNAGIDLDSLGNIFIAGSSQSSWGDPILPYNGGTSNAFAARLDSSGELQWNTFFGGGESDWGNCICVDSSGTVYLGGKRYIRWEQYSDIFAVKLSPNGELQGQSFLIKKYLGNAYGIEVDSSGNVIMTGTSWNGSPHEPDYVFAVKWNSDGLLQWDTDSLPIYGAPGFALDELGNLYLSGLISSGFMGNSDLQVIKLNAQGESQWDKLIGGNSIDNGRGIALAGFGYFYVVGNSMEAWGNPLNPFSGGGDNFVAKFFEPSAFTVTIPNGGQTWIGGTVHNLRWTTSGSLANVKLEYSMNGGGNWTTLVASAPNTGSYPWTLPIVGSTNCLVRISEASTGVPFDTSDALFTIASAPPKIGLSKSDLHFGAEQNGAKTPPEDLVISNLGTGDLNWTATPSADWLSVSPTSGVGNGVISIGIARTDLAAGTYTGTVSISDPSASNSPQTISVDYYVYDSWNSGPAFGYFETPLANVTVASCIPVTGWALDDIGVQSIKIYRGTGLADRIFIGEAIFIEGARPDVEAAYPTYPQNKRAGWGYMLLTNFLPNGGNGPVHLLAYATDLEGQEVLLGSKAIVCDNANAIKPFGAIDTPVQGGTASGASFANFGWVLTPQPNAIPVDGSTITVWVDGLPKGHPVYNNYRADIATLFPGYANSNGAVGYYYLNTIGYADGVHTIEWSATDSGGNTDGIGSRYFTIQNAVPAPGATAAESGIVRTSARSAEELAALPEDIRTPVYIKRGLAESAPVETVLPGEDGVIRIAIPEVTRLAVYLNEQNSLETRVEMAERGQRLRNRTARTGNDSVSPRDTAIPADSRYEAFQLVGMELRSLPIGASFDPETGAFYWQPGPGFIGEYAIVLVKDENGASTKRTIIISILPR